MQKIEKKIRQICKILKENKTTHKVLLVLLFIFLLVAAASKAPTDFPLGANLTIKEGDNLEIVSTELKEKGLIRSETYFTFLILLRGDSKSLISGDYIFDERVSSFGIANKITKGRYGLPTKTVTLPEGLTIKEMAEILEETLEQFDKQDFLTINEDLEGFLFPDTYIFFENATAKDVTKELRENYEEKINDLNLNGAKVSEPIENIIKMASILEREANSRESMKIVSGILWKRLENSMPLQVDASFVYFLGKGTDELSLDDLKIDNPYNSYKYLGLPPTPISNPGIQAIEAAINPEDTDYWYFLTGDDGQMYYSKTFEEHKRKKELYL